MKTGMNIIFILLLMLNICSCIDDNGNYKYYTEDELIGIKVSGIAEHYDLESLKDTTITPTIKGLKENVEYTYTWYIFSNAQVLMQKRDTIGRTPELTYNVPLATDEYTLCFSIKNVKTGIEFLTKSLLSVTSSVGKGWYVLKDDNVNTDLDIITFDGTTKSNVYGTINGKKLPGKAHKIASTTEIGYEIIYPDGTVEVKFRKSSILFLSEMDLTMCDADNLKITVPFESMFAVAPKVKKPQNAFPASPSYFIVNDGKIHNTYTMTPPPHKFGYQTLGNYKISADNIFVGRSGCLMFDEISKSLIVDKGAFNTSPAIGLMLTDPLLNPYDCNKMQCDVVYMKGRSNVRAKEGIGIFNKSGQFYIAELNNSFETDKNPITSWNKIDDNKEIKDAKLFAINANARSKYIYFLATDGKIKSYTIHDGAERTQIASIPANEKVVYMEHLIYKGWKDEPNHINALVVLTNGTAGWKLYTYTFLGETGDIVDKQTLRGSGEGNGKYVFYRSKWSL